ncbi:MAG TPA: LCP family protein [Anaerolineales bacterium]|nr:LCP family protein [Anaerolineales bacterium]
MPQEFSIPRTQKRSPCYNPTSMDKYNPIIGNRRPPAIAQRTSRFTKSPVMWGLLVIFLITLTATVYLTYSVVHDAAASRFNNSNLPGLSLNEQPFSNNPEINIESPLQANSGPEPIPWDGANRVTVLVMGLDYRDWEGEGPSRTDSMMLVTMDPVSRTAGMLSIPRDLWVNIPGFDYGKINTAYFLGELYNLEGGGPGLAIRTVEDLLGIDINYYAQIDFAAFENFIDQIGGVDVEVPYEMTVDPIGPGNTVTLQQGVQHLDGPTALAYARNRETIGSDFDRADRQQQVVMAVFDQVTSLGTLPKLIANSPTIYDNLRYGIHTNLNLKETISLAWTVAQIPRENIKRGMIGPDATTRTFSADGLDILLPNMEAVRVVRDQIFSITSGTSPLATEFVSSNDELRKAEAASVSVLNATTTPGLAAETSDYLKNLGINVTVTGNADEASESTVIIDYTGKPYTVEYLVKILNIQANSIYSRYDPNSQTDIAILLGVDWAENNSMP